MRALLDRRPDQVTEVSRWLAVASVLTVAFLHAFAAWGGTEPVFRADEIGNIGNSHVIAHGGRDWILAGSGYMPGLGLLLAPVWWFTSNVTVVYIAGLVLGIAAAVLTVWPLSRIARAVGVPAHLAVVVASVVMFSPARTLGSNYVVGENVTTLAFAAAAAAAIAFARRPTVRLGVLTGMASAGVFLGHGRGIAVVVAAGIWALLLLRRAPRAAIALGISAAMGSVLAFALYRWVTGHLYWTDGRLEETFGGAGRSIADYLGTVMGLGWYATAAWPAIAIVGVLVIGRRSRRGYAGAFLLLSLVFTVALACVQLDKTGTVQSAPRLDTWIYGRYIDHVLTVIAVIGLGVLVRVRWPALGVVVTGIAAAVAAAFVLTTVPQMPVGGSWVDFHIAGVSHLLSLDAFAETRAEPWLLLTGAIVFITALVMVATVVRNLPALLLALYFAGLSIANDDYRVDIRDDRYRVWSSAVVPAIESVPDHATVGIDRDFGRFINVFAYFSTPRTIYLVDIVDGSPVDAAGRVDSVDIVISHPLSEPLADLGARRIAGTDVAELTMWVFPGAVADELTAQGRLLPAGTAK